MNYRIYIELVLVVLLVALLYQKSNFLNNLMSYPLAKLGLLVSVVIIAHLYGRNAGIISALIAILLFHNLFEGNQNMSDGEKEEGEKSEEAEKPEEGEEAQEAQEPEEPEENQVNNNMLSNENKTDLEVQMRPKNSNEEEAIPNNTTTTNENEPLAMPTSTKEGFSILN
jgi:hypothetical protein